MKVPDNCGNCRYFEKRDPDKPASVIGTCHRYPPTSRDVSVAADYELVAIEFPKTSAHAWCGEHRKPEKTFYDGTYDFG